jgi:soluble lytic murein transglycosylase-like protein
VAVLGRSGDVEIWQLVAVVGATTAVTAVAICQIAAMRPSTPPRNAIVEASFNAAPPNTTTVVAKFTAMSPNAIVDAAFDAAAQSAPAHAEVTASLSPGPMLAFAEDEAAALLPDRDHASPQEDRSPSAADSAEAAKRELPYLKYYVYSEVPPERKPADTVLESLSTVPLGTPLEEIKRAADAFGVDYNFMKAVARIESDFDPTQRTGSYIGLFQLSEYEFAKYGSGDITNPRDNAVAAAYKFVTEAALFEDATHKKPTFSDLYLIHQQGWQGAAEHVGHPDWVAWKSMCSTDEGLEKGEQWCKRAIWKNTLPAVKHEWKSVDRLTSGAFVAMWRDRIDALYARYSDEGGGEQAKQ